MEIAESIMDRQTLAALSLPANPTCEESLVVRFCTLCAQRIPESRVARNSHTCCAEHHQEERRQRRAYKAMKSCRLCGRTAKRKRAPVSEVTHEDLEGVRRGHN